MVLYCWQNAYVLGKLSISSRIQSHYYFLKNVFYPCLPCALLNRAFVVFCSCSILFFLSFLILFSLSGIYPPPFAYRWAFTFHLTNPSVQSSLWEKSHGTWRAALQPALQLPGSMNLTSHDKWWDSWENTELRLPAPHCHTYSWDSCVLNEWMD